MAALALPGVGCLREQSFRLLFTSQLLSAVGDTVASVAVPFAIIALGGGAGDIGLVLGARAVPLVLFLLIGGVWAIVAITFVYGAAEAFFRPALSGILPQSVSPERLQEAYGLIAMTPAVGMLAGGILGGTAVALISPAGAIALDAATFAVAIVLLGLARFRVVAMAERGRSFLHDLRDGWDAFRKRTWLVVVVLGESFYALLVMPAIFVAGPLISEQYLDGATSYAAIVSAFGLGFVTGGLIVARLTPRRPLVLAYLVTLPFVGTFIAMAVPAPTAVIALCAWFGGAVIIISGSLLETTITRQVTPDLRSRVGSFRALGSQVCQPIGFGIAGAIIAGIGLSGMMWLAVAAVFANVAMVLATPSVRAMDDSAPGLA